MKKYFVLSMLLGLFILIGTTESFGQGPNLVVDKALVNFQTRTIQFVVRNIGNRAAGRELTYVEVNMVGADSMTTPHSQVRLWVPALAPRRAWFRRLRFSAFAPSAKPVLGNVNNLTTLNLVIRADAKNMVTETDENNNVYDADHP